jgi:transposase
MPARKSSEREEARQLRTREGMPMKRIADRLGVSPASVHGWTRDIVLTPDQQRHNLRGPHGPQNPAVVARRAAAWRRKNRDRRVGFQLEGRQRARRHEALHEAGCMLYWAEGSKCRNAVRLTNSDRHLVRFFCRFLRECFQVDAGDISMSLNVYLNNGLSIEEIEDHWLSSLELPRSALRKHAIDFKPTSSSGRKRNKLPFGVCSVQVHSTRLAQHIYGAIQEYGGFEQPDWLD